MFGSSGCSQGDEIMYSASSRGCPSGKSVGLCPTTTQSSLSLATSLYVKGYQKFDVCNASPTSTPNFAPSNQPVIAPASAVVAPASVNPPANINNPPASYPSIDTNTFASDSSSNSSLSSGAIAGIIIGSIAGVFILIAIAVYFMKKNPSKEPVDTKITNVMVDDENAKV